VLINYLQHARSSSHLKVFFTEFKVFLKLTTSDTGKSEDEEAFDLSEAYSILCGQLWKNTSFVQFCIISETLELMLKTKVSPPTIPYARQVNISSLAL